MQYDDFQLDEKYAEYEALAQEQANRRNSEFLMREAIISKKDELRSYNRLLRLYGAESPNLQPKNPLLNKASAKQPFVNKILETKHNLSVENTILNFFIFVASIFIIFQFSLIAIIKLDLELPSFNVINYELFFHYAYLAVLVIGKCLTYLFMLTFFSRIYIGVKVFKKTVTTNILLKLINLQFMGFLSASLLTTAVIGGDVLLKYALTQLEIVDSEIGDQFYNVFLENFKSITGYLDLVLHSTIVVGLVLTGVRKVVKMFTGSQSVKLEDAEELN